MSTHKYEPSYRKAIGQWVRHKITGQGVALKRPIRSTYMAKARTGKYISAFGQRSYTYSGLRGIKRQLGLK